MAKVINKFFDKQIKSQNTKFGEHSKMTEIREKLIKLAQHLRNDKEKCEPMLRGKKP